MSTQREWTTIREYEDILFDYYNGIARITINRERYRNAFTPTTTAEMSDALRICREEGQRQEESDDGQLQIFCVSYYTRERHSGEEFNWKFCASLM